MNKRTVLELLKPKTKMLGFSRKELANVADAIMASLPEDIDEADEEISISQKIDEYLPLLRVGQSAASRQSALTMRRTNVGESLEEDDELGNKDYRQSGNDDDFADAPRWAKRLAKMLEQGNESNIRRRAKVEALAENIGSMGKHLLRDFDRHSFRNNDEWETYYADLKEEVSEYLQDKGNKGLDSLSRPAGAVPGRMFRRNNDEMTDEEVIKLAKGE